MKRKLIASLLCLCMLVSLLPVAAFAAEDESTETKQTEQSTPVDGATPTNDDADSTTEPQEETPASPAETPAPAPTVTTDPIAAMLHDTRDPQLVSDPELAAGYSISTQNATVNGNITTIPVTLTHTSLRAHANGSGQMGFWVGIGVPQSKDAAYYGKFGQLGTSDDVTKLTYNKSPVSSQTENSKTYDTFYFNATAKSGNGTYTLIQKTGSDANAKYVVYNITLNVTRKIELDSKTGFYWRTNDKPAIEGINDWRPQTMLVSLVDAVPVNEFLWADIKAPNGKVYGIYFGAGSIDQSTGAMTVYQNFAWSFLTQSQFEQWPKDVAVGVQSLGNYEVTIYELPAEPAQNATEKPTGATQIAKTTIAVVPDLPTATLGYTSVADTSIVEDCVAKTMYVRFAGGLPEETYLWFEITDPNKKVYEIGANAADSEDDDYPTTKFAWSFTNKGQFEVWPDIEVGKVTSGTYTVKAYLSPDEITTKTKPAGCVELWTKTVEVSETAVTAAATTNSSLTGAAAALTGEDKTAAEATANSVKAESESALSNAAQKIAADDGKTYAATAENTLKSEGITPAQGQTVSVVVQPYLDVQLSNYDSAEKTITVNISAKSRTLATVADVENDTLSVKGDTGVSNPNAVKLSEAVLTVNDPIELSIQLPAGFAENDAVLYVKHTKNGTAHFHRATVSTVDSNLVAKFVSTDGLSPFEITANATAPAVSIGTTYYTTLQDAINAVTGGETISLTDAYSIGMSETVTLTGTNKNFTIDTTSATLNTEGKNKLVAALKAGGAADAVLSGNIITVTATVEGTTPPDDDNNDNNNNNNGSSGGSSASVSVPSASNGKVTVSNNHAKKGDTVTITLTPNTGYVVDTVTVTDSKGNTVEVSKTDDTHYTFVMPEGRVTVKATFKQADTPPATGFTDVAADAYYADAVKWAVDKGITNGLTATTFGPNNSCTRGQMVTFLWRAAGSPAATGTNSFSDVASGEYYYDAVLWAVEKGITNGTSATTFSPNATVNRGQTVTFLYRYAESPAATGESSFTDVAADAFYADAVKWAVAEGITNGTSATTFAPASNCTRGQIVTFMYRQMAE